MSSLPITADERTPLVNENENMIHQSFPRRVMDMLQAKRHPSWLSSYRWFIFSSWFNIFLVFVPLSAIAHYMNWDAALRFGFSFVAIIPLAALLGTATEQMSLKLGQTLAGLLNASLGNTVEIIVGITALLRNELRIVQTSLLGSILSNLLLVLGSSFFAGGIVKKENHFRTTAAQIASSLMTLACITLVIPAAYHSAKIHGSVGDGIDSLLGILQAVDSSDLDDRADHGLKIISRGTALLLFLVYICYLRFQLGTHAHLFKSLPHDLANDDDQFERETEVAHMSVPAAAVGLLAVAVITSFCADFLVASIEETANRYNIPKPFIGLVLIPIVANAAEHVTSVWMAMKDKMELTIGICVGSSIQIAAFVVPLLVIIGWITDHDLTLFFADFETIVLFVSVLLVNLLIQDGKSNYMEGLMLITLYFVIALAFWVS